MLGESFNDPVVFNLDSITGGALNENVVQIGFIAMAREGTDNGTASLTVNFSGGGQKDISDTMTQLGNLFFGAEAPSGEYITSFTYSTSGFANEAWPQTRQGVN